MKRSVLKEWRKRRVAYAKWLLSKRQPTLARFAYTNGTTFYLARGPQEETDKRRACLGKFV